MPTSDAAYDRLEGLRADKLEYLFLLPPLIDPPRLPVSSASSLPPGRLDVPLSPERKDRSEALSATLPPASLSPLR